jgi:hypothetical protein
LEILEVVPMHKSAHITKGTADDGASRFMTELALPGERLDFSKALAILKVGGRVSRSGWAGDEFLFYVPGTSFRVNGRDPLRGVYPEGTPIDRRPHIDQRAADGTVGVWNSTTSDLLADDWAVAH